MEPVQLTTSDGHELAGDVIEATVAPVGSIVVCHPHPLYGGNRHHPVVRALCDTTASIGIHALRFDFRLDHGDGVAERTDVDAAVEFLVLRYPDLAVYGAGYSFGAAVLLNTEHERFVAKVAIAPPLNDVAVTTPRVPTLVLTPAHDQFCPPEQARPIVDTWPEAEFGVIEMADHFLNGRAAAAADRAAEWLRTQIRA